MKKQNIKYAIDLSNEGVTFWSKVENTAWKLLGKVALDASDFSKQIEDIKKQNNLESGDTNAAKVRLPRTEVFVSELKLDGVIGDAANAKIEQFLTSETPYQPQDLIYDIETPQGSDITYIAAVTKRTINEAQNFISSYGFNSLHYTTKCDKSKFKNGPKFLDGPKPKPVVIEQKKETPTPVKSADIVKAEPVAKNIPPQKKPKPSSIPPTEIKKQPKEITASVARPKSEKNSEAFNTVRTAPLVAPNKKGGKKEPTLSKAKLPEQKSRISIGLPDTSAAPPSLQKKPSTAPIADARTGMAQNLLNTRNIAAVLAFLVLVVGYWFLSGKPQDTDIASTPQVETSAATDIAANSEINSDSGTNTQNEITITNSASIEKDTAVTVVENTDDQVVADNTSPVQTSGNETDANNQTPNKPELRTQETIAKLTENAKDLPAPITDNPIETVDTKVDAALITPTPTVQKAALIPTKAGTKGAEGITLYAGLPTITPPHRDQLKISTDPLKNVLPKIRSQEFQDRNSLIANQKTDINDTIDVTKDSQNEQDILALADLSLKNILPKARSKEFEILHTKDVAESPALNTDNIADTAIDILALADPSLKNISPKPRSKEFETLHQPKETTPVDAPVETTDNQATTEEPVVDILALADPNLRTVQPKVRPGNIFNKATTIKDSLVLSADPTLAAKKPKRRPANLSITKEPEKPIEPAAPTKAKTPPTVDPAEINGAVQQAIRNIVRPRARPRSLPAKAAKVKAAQQQKVKTAALAPTKGNTTTKANNAETALSTQKQATERAGLNKRRISLIGVYGSPSSRRALVRLPSGRYVKVKPGQNVSGWKVAAIGESSVRITKGSRNQVLRMPK